MMRALSFFLLLSGWVALVCGAAPGTDSVAEAAEMHKMAVKYAEGTCSLARAHGSKETDETTCNPQPSISS